MKATIKKEDKEFHAVEFMRNVRSKLSQQYLDDKPKYLAFLKKAMEDFKDKQQKTFGKQS